MHIQARRFIEQALAAYGPVSGAVVEFGSRDVNGSIRDLLPTAKSYVGIDIAPGAGVDIVCDAADWQPGRAYAVVITTETFEHTRRWREIIRVAAKSLAPDGILLITCASLNRRPHSATRANQLPAEGEYYANVQPAEFQEAIDAAGLEATIQLDEAHGDLYAICRAQLPPSGRIRLIGAGMWRTGTVSLRAALGQLGLPAHHMTEVMQQPQQISDWLRIVRGAQPQWSSLLAGYAATLDWPSLAFWPELIAAYPQAIVLLSTRPAAEWWRSIEQTVLVSAPTVANARMPWDHLVVELFERYFVSRFPSRAAALKAYREHNAAVRTAVPFNRLLEWQPSDGWLPLCRALHVPMPSNPFPHLNTTADYRRHHRIETARLSREK